MFVLLTLSRTSSLVSLLKIHRHRNFQCAGKPCIIKYTIMLGLLSAPEYKPHHLILKRQKNVYICRPHLSISRRCPRLLSVYSPSLQEVFKLGPSAFITSEIFCHLFAVFTLPSPTSHHRFIDAKLMCSSSISFFDSQIDCL